MAQPQTVARIFNGKLDTDNQTYRIKQGDYVDSLNITRDSEFTGKDEVVSNIQGNREVSFNLHAGQNKCIGKFEDKVKFRIYYFIWNSLNYDFILYYDGLNGTIVKLIANITDTGGDDVLNFNPSKRINHVDVLYRDEGDLLSWTDGYNEPREINVATIIAGTYSVIKSSFISAAKMPPLTSPTGVYGSDSARNANALRRTLFMFTHRWQYDNFEKSSYSTYSKIPLPIGYYGSDNNIDDTKNNFITVTVDTGDENVTDIEIAMRSNIANAWGDFVQVISLNKAQLLIPNNSTYSFLFYNDTTYPPITEGVEYVDGVQVVPLFSWIPPLADCQCLPNGNVKAYAAITEGFPNYPVNDLQVTMTVANQTNTPPDTDPPTITYTQIGSATFVFTVSGSVPTGTEYKIYIFFNGTPPTQTFGVRQVATYTSVGGDTINDVASALYTQFNAYPSVPAIAASYFATNYWQANFGTAGSYVFSTRVVPGSSGGGGISTEKTWLWSSNYIFGLVYADEQNRDMPGVTTFVNPVNTDNDFFITTPDFSLDGSNSVQTPVISASINHLPPAGAVNYYWVRRRQTYGSFLFYETCDYQSDTDYLYFCLANIDTYHTDNNQFIYGSAPITSESRIKIIAGISSSAYNGDLWTQDYQILGTVTKTLTGGSSPANDKLFIKVNKPSGSISPAYSTNMLVMIYTPAVNASTLADSVYYEWGEGYGIYSLAGVNYHRGQLQDQTASQPATFEWAEGDVYFRERTMYNELLVSTPYVADTVPIMDANFSDFFNSAVNDNGRAQAIEVNARKTFFPTLIRFSGAYQDGTNVNELNRFYEADFDEYNRQFGIIRKLFIEKQYLYVFQQFDIGVVPILIQIVLDTAGNPLQANSDILLNKIQYAFKGQYGIGDVPESFAYAKGAMYGIDNNKAVAWRLAQDGITALSIIYNMNAYFVAQLAAYRIDLNNGIAPAGTVYSGNPTVYGAFDQYTNKYVIAMEEINRYSNPTTLQFHQDAATVTFLETRDESEGFESPVSYHPEMMACLNNTFASFKNGRLWLHDSAVYCNFYGVQYDAYIVAVFNDNVIQKKTWLSVAEESNVIWEAPEITSQLISYATSPQQSKLIPSNFKILEGTYHSSFLRAVNSQKGWINGDILKGQYLIVKFQVTQASGFVYLNVVTLKYINSQLSV